MNIKHLFVLFTVLLTGTVSKILLAEEDPATAAAFSKCMAALGETNRKVDGQASQEKKSSSSACGHDDPNCKSDAKASSSEASSPISNSSSSSDAGKGTASNSTSKPNPTPVAISEREKEDTSKKSLVNEPRAE